MKEHYLYIKSGISSGAPIPKLFSFFGGGVVGNAVTENLNNWDKPSEADSSAKAIAVNSAVAGVVQTAIGYPIYSLFNTTGFNIITSNSAGAKASAAFLEYVSDGYSLFINTVSGVIGSSINGTSTETDASNVSGFGIQECAGVK